MIENGKKTPMSLNPSDFSSGGKLSLVIPLNNTMHTLLSSLNDFLNYGIWYRDNGTMKFESELRLDSSKTNALFDIDHCSEWVIAGSPDFNITVTQSNHGNITSPVSSVTKKCGQEIEIQVTPESGYRYTLSVTDADGNVTDMDMPDTSNVLQFYTEDNTKVSVRPSGTEPKIKFYIEVKGILKSAADYVEADALAAKKIEAVRASLGI